MLGIAKRIQTLSFASKIPLLFVFLMFCPLLWASQEAVVIADKAIIYSDKTMSSPVGYIPRGKRVTVGEVPRNRAQVYPIIVSGRVAYVRVVDLSTELESIDSNRLVAERFTKTTSGRLKGQYSLSAFTFPSQITLNRSVDQLENKDAFTWNGFQLKGTAFTKSRFDLGVVFGYAEGKEGIEAFRMMELGPEFSFRIYSGNTFVLRWQNQLLGVPFASYSLGSKARVNGYGFSAGTGLNANWVFGNHWGLDLYGGFHYTKLFGFEIPDPRNATSTEKFPNIVLNPSFVGTRLGIGATYRY